MTFVTLFVIMFVAYDLCRHTMFVVYDVCCIIMFVALLCLLHYYVCCIIIFVAKDVCRIMTFFAYSVFRCIAYDVYRSADTGGECTVGQFIR